MHTTIGHTLLAWAVMTERDRIAELERLLREEREFRHAAEQRVESLTDKAEVWRRRADERAERIDRLVAEADLPAMRRLVGRMRRSVRRPVPGPTNSQAPAAAQVAARPVPTMPIVRAATCLDSPELTPALAALDTIDVAAASADPFVDADIVVVEPNALAGLSDGARRRFESWLELDARQPLVVWVGDDETRRNLPGPLRRDDVVAATRRRVVDELRRRTDRRVVHLPASFDPGVYAPHHRRAAPRSATKAGREGATIAGEPTDPNAVWVPDVLLTDPPGWLLDTAAMAVPIVAGPASDPPPDSAGSAARRWAYARHAPWVRAAEILRHTGLDVPDPTPSVAALLVSRRPEEVPAAITRIARQTHRPLDLVVGLHGNTRTKEIEAAIAGAGLPATILELDAALSLGECLNRAASVTPASIVAKIDDDDHYGPAYLEDAVQALHYSGAAIVVKAAQFTYLAGRDVTVLRRARQEETMLDGSTAGATFVVRRGVWDAVRFPHRTRGEDIRFLRGARAVGAQVYASSRWEFCYVRRSGHTWTAADETFLAGAEPAWAGYQPERVEVPSLLART